MNTIVSLWVSAYFQGRTVGVQEGKYVLIWLKIPIFRGKYHQTGRISLAFFRQTRCRQQMRKLQAAKFPRCAPFDPGLIGLVRGGFKRRP